MEIDILILIAFDQVMRIPFAGKANIEGVRGHRDDLVIEFFSDSRESIEIGVV